MQILARRYPPRSVQASPPIGGKAKIASRSKFVAEANVGSLLFVDRLGSISDNPAAMSMNESRHSSAARQSSTSISSAASSDDALLTVVAGAGHAASFSDAGSTAPHACVDGESIALRMSAVRRQMNMMSDAFFHSTAMTMPQGAAPTRLMSIVGEGPVLCFPSVRFQSFYRS
jgi:hypothetical protein